jgi:hypothetical protein
MQTSYSDWRRDAVYFVAGPAVFTGLAVMLFAIRPWPVPIPSQGALLQPAPAIVLLAAGLVGVVLSSRAGFPSAPPLADRGAWVRILLFTALGGVAFGVGLLGVDAATNFTSEAVKVLGVTWVNVPLPWSLAHYGAAAVLLECAYRLFPIPLFAWLLGLLLKGRGSAVVFVVLAVLTSSIEPASILALARPGALAPLAALMGIAFVANIFEAVEMKRHGWPAPILFRLSFYGVWHCFGPYLLASSSVLFPGPH